MISFLLFFIVLMISYNTVTARPMIESDLNILSGNGVDGYDGDKMLYKMPTIIRQGMTIKINGTLATPLEMFKVALIDSDTGNSDCNITLDFNSGIINVSPAVEDYDTATYNLDLQQGDQPTFLLRLIARVNDDKQMIAVHFEVNDEGESAQLICNINFENIGYIEMQQGVASVDNLVFKFKENR